MTGYKARTFCKQRNLEKSSGSNGLSTPASSANQQQDRACISEPSNKFEAAIRRLGGRVLGPRFTLTEDPKRTRTAQKKEGQRPGVRPCESLFIVTTFFFLSIVWYWIYCQTSMFLEQKILFKIVTSKPIYSRE
jgi:hypothetical protein